MLSFFGGEGGALLLEFYSMLLQNNLHTCTLVTMNNSYELFTKTDSVRSRWLDIGQIIFAC